MSRPASATPRRWPIPPWSMISWRTGRTRRRGRRDRRPKGRAPDAAEHQKRVHALPSDGAKIQVAESPKASRSWRGAAQPSDDLDLLQMKVRARERSAKIRFPVFEPMEPPSAIFGGVQAQNFQWIGNPDVSQFAQDKAMLLEQSRASHQAIAIVAAAALASGSSWNICCCRHRALFLRSHLRKVVPNHTGMG